MADSGGPNREELLRMAIQSAKQNNIDGARVMLRQVLEQDKTNERAMLWMAKIGKTPQERRKWIENVIKVNPNNEAAQKALAKMTYNKSASENRKLFYFGGAGIIGFFLITVIFTALWAFWPLT